MAARLLIIEDHADNLELMTYLLKSCGYELFMAESGKAGLELAERERPDLIICDIQMPGVDGWQVAKYIKSHAELKTIPLIGVTALAMVGDRDRVLSAGFNGYITKPITPQTFAADVAAFLSNEQRCNQSPQPDVSETGSRANPPMSGKHDRGAASSQRGTILVVDNTRTNLELARSILLPCGYQVVCAEGGREALQMAKQSPPDLILSDVSMPGGDGFELIKALKADPELRGIPVLLSSATEPEDLARKMGLESGAMRFLPHPIDPQILLNEVEACFRMRPRRGGNESRVTEGK